MDFSTWGYNAGTDHFDYMPVGPPDSIRVRYRRNILQVINREGSGQEASKVFAIRRCLRSTSWNVGCDSEQLLAIGIKLDSRTSSGQERVCWVTATAIGVNKYPLAETREILSRGLSTAYIEPDVIHRACGKSGFCTRPRGHILTGGRVWRAFKRF